MSKMNMKLLAAAAVLAFDANGKLVARHRTRDNAPDLQGMAFRTLDGVQGQRGRYQPGQFFDQPMRTHDGRTVDSTGAFMIGELERLDQTINQPLAAVTWGRDIELREDVSIADEVASFTQSTFASGGSLGGGHGGTNGAARTGKAWIGKATNQIGSVSVDIGKVAQPLRPWALELSYTILELESAARLGRPVDAHKLDALQLKHDMDVDEQVYVGDAQMGDTGLVNHAKVTNVTNVANGASTSPLWSTKTPGEILKDVNELVVDVWTKSGYAVMPDRILLPPQAFGYISTQIISSGAGNISILKYLEENNILTASGKGKLQFYSAKWLVGAGSGGVIGTQDGHDRMVCYTKDKKYVRYPKTMLQRTPLQYQSIYHMCTYFCRLGVIEVVYPETIGYRDGLS